ncbi:helix-turn-helix transcriptional regulator [Candidatus Poriferisocius sp.]|uniref:helix-turn-helix transcriptional regulator n=1 Tax=Candidatus Poriferisocius sp. TaxID=3101276 RepID=UPI003B58D118
MGKSVQGRHQALAKFLRQRRATLSPDDFGLAHSGRRRTPGLRREEVAVLVGVSTSWYTWLEQSRDVTPSVQVIDSLARVYALTPAERRYVLELAHPEIVSDLPAEWPEASMHRMINMLPAPAAIMDCWWFYLAWNRAVVAVLGPAYAELPPDRRNMLWLLFQTSAIHDLIPDWEHVARTAVGQFRAAYAEVADWSVANELVAELHDLSPEFGEMWAAQEVAWREPEVRRVHHPAGNLTFEVLALRSHDARFPRLIIWAPADDETEALVHSLLAELDSSERGYPEEFASPEGVVG